jgi:hypothetical protein
MPQKSKSHMSITFEAVFYNLFIAKQQGHVLLDPIHLLPLIIIRRRSGTDNYDKLRSL